MLNPDVDVDRSVDNNVPPTGESYHLNVPKLDVFADKLTEPFPHRDPFTPVGVAGTELTKAFTAVRDELVHVALLNST